MTRFCTSCGQPVNDGVRFCTNCGAAIPVEQQTNYSEPQPQPQPQPQYQQQQYQQPLGIKPKSYLVLGILTTILCCIPFGIVSIIQASKVDNLWNAGRYNEAQTASNKARNWAIAAMATSLISTILYIVLVALGVVAGLDY